MRFYRITLSSLLFLFPVFLFANTGLLDRDETLSKLNLLVAQYEARIKQLQAENTVLKTEMAKAGIKIPLSDLSGSLITIPVSTPSSPETTGTPTSSVGVTPEASSTLTQISDQYGKDVAGFISRIQKDWSGISSHYGFPLGAKLAGYEFVQTGASDHVFADIIVGTGTTGVYDIKILYQFEKEEYKRKLIGIFEYNPATARYTTRTGSNPFGGVTRTFVKDPYFAGIVSVPSTALPQASTGATSTGVTTPVISSGTSSASISDITKAYNEKRYLSTISLSNTYLESNPATQEVLNIRYRTFFIIGKYAESLAEIAKIEQISTLDKQTACNAQVIATYSKNQSLVDRYGAICKK